MKKAVFFSIVMLIAATSAFAVNFAPDILRLSAAQTISYKFDGSTLSIPVTVTGAPASTIFLVYTKDKASSVVKVKNGFLGWHYANKVDTCIYFSGLKALAKGSNTVTWDGKDKTGKAVAKGDYTYYMYAYDGTGVKKPVVQKISLTYGTGPIVTRGSDGKVLAKPLFYTWNLGSKWAIGGDPVDSTLVETTRVNEAGYKNKVQLLPTNVNYYFLNMTTLALNQVAKYQWVPNGVSVLQTAWGEKGYSANWPQKVSAVYADIALAGDVIVLGRYAAYEPQADASLATISQDDGTIVNKFDLTDRWTDLNDLKAGAQANGGPGQLVGRNNKVIMASFCDCYREMVDPLTESAADLVVWGNDNGDYVGDHNFETTSKTPWVCFDFMPAPYTYTTDADANLFSTCGAYDLGAVSFILFGPDGTGIGNFAFAGETAQVKNGTLYVDDGSPFDGMYTDNQSTAASAGDKRGVWFIGHDSIKGVISSQVGVADAPAAFSVAQNTPNPFNPTTSVTFTLSKPGKVTVDVFNSAGQKIDTIANSRMTAGSHTVTWNASKFSAGVYFCTVAADAHSKTVKMTLLK